MKDKSDLMRLYIKSGIKDIDTIKEDYNKFDTGGPINTEEALLKLEKIIKKENHKPIYNQQEIQKNIKRPYDFILYPNQKEITFEERLLPETYVQLPKEKRHLYLISDDIKNGESYLYNSLGFEERNNYPGAYIRDKKTGDIYNDALPDEGSLNTKEFEVIPYDSVKNKLPKRDYIGGTEKEAALKTLDKLTGIKDYIYNLSSTYNVDPNIVLQRLVQEGFLSQIATDYNYSSVKAQKEFPFKDYIDNEVEGFGSIGLDTFGNYYDEGKLNLRREFPMYFTEQPNEDATGRFYKSANFDNLHDALEANVAMLEYFTKEAKKRGISDEELPAYVNAMYNMGENHSDLKNTEYVQKTYAVSNYYKNGGPKDKAIIIDPVVVTPRISALNASREAEGPNANFLYAQDMGLKGKLGTLLFANIIGDKLFDFDPHTCLNTVTGFYNPKATVASNVNFALDPEAYGYQKIQQEEVKPGDIIMLHGSNDVPSHATIFDGIATEEGIHNGFPVHVGDTLINYSNGGRERDDYRIKGPITRFDNPEYSGGNFSKKRTYYKYVGKKKKN